MVGEAKPAALGRLKPRTARPPEGGEAPKPHQPPLLLAIFRIFLLFL